MNFLAFCIGVLAGGVLGAVGMYLLIKETRLDLDMQGETIYGNEKPKEFEPVPELEDEETLEDIIYGDF